MVFSPSRYAAGDWGLGVQATASEFNPGFLELRVRNATGAMSDSWTVQYDLYCRNDQGRSSAWDFSYSLDGSSFVEPCRSCDTLSPAAANSTSFEANSFSNDAAGQRRRRRSTLFLRWSSADFGGSGSRDEFALDNVGISAAVPVPEPSC